ncbi:hypothetical protein PIB30_081980 [Stylosanthes scabra]|uniref:Aminotransferase-like plant mobile domain-containing protein n=1 Tax=Stylosanthes scabra TaxID=79078 RepID=A0ABU6YPG6_9FABA|nr:hypothetical protein [Stylosanthes scabra]
MGMGENAIPPPGSEWVNWVARNNEQRRWTIHDYRQMLDNITNDSRPYDEHWLGANLVPNDMFTHADLWSALSPLISFECLEWCLINWVLRQFGWAQGIPDEPRNLGKYHNEYLTGPKIKNWGVEYNDWIGEWINRAPLWHPNNDPPTGVPMEEYFGNMDKGSLRSKKRRFGAFLDRAPRLSVAKHPELKVWA